MKGNSNDSILLENEETRLSNYNFNSIFLVILLSLVLAVASSASIIPLPAFAQSSLSQMTNEALIDQLASRLQNGTGGENTLVKPIIEQIAAKILDTKGNVILHRTLVNLTQAIKPPASDIVALSIFRLSNDEASGNVSSVDKAISWFTQQVGKGDDPKKLLMQTTIQLIGGSTLNQKIDYIASQVENTTGSDHVMIKKILDMLTLQIANFKTEGAARTIINQITGEIQKDPDGTISQSLSRLANNGTIFR